jgi:dTDP-glucose 4,6-dehydratase
MQRKPDISKAEAILDWEPKVMRDEGLKLTYEWFKKLPEERLYRKEHRDFKDFIKRV